MSQTVANEFSCYKCAGASAIFVRFRQFHQTGFSFTNDSAASLEWTWNWFWFWQLLDTDHTIHNTQWNAVLTWGAWSGMSAVDLVPVSSCSWTDVASTGILTLAPLHVHTHRHTHTQTDRQTHMHLHLHQTCHFFMPRVCC